MFCGQKKNFITITKLRKSLRKFKSATCKPITSFAITHNPKWQRQKSRHACAIWGKTEIYFQLIQPRPSTAIVVAQSLPVPVEEGSLNDGAELATDSYALRELLHVPPNVPSCVVNGPLWKGPQ